MQLLTLLKKILDPVHLFLRSPIIEIFFISCFDMWEVPRSPWNWNWNLLYFLPFIFTFEQCVASHIKVLRLPLRKLCHLLLSFQAMRWVYCCVASRFSTHKLLWDKTSFVVDGVCGIALLHLFHVYEGRYFIPQGWPQVWNKIRDISALFLLFRNGILLPKLFWPTVRKNCSSDREKLLKFEAEGWEFAKFWDH